MKKYIVIAGVVTLFITSCIPSLHPIFTEKTRITDDRLEGFWVDNEDGILNSNVKLEMQSQLRKELDKYPESAFSEVDKDSLIRSMENIFNDENGQSEFSRLVKEGVQNELNQKLDKSKKSIFENYWEFKRAEEIYFTKVDENDKTHKTTMMSWDEEGENRFLEKGFTEAKRERLPFYILTLKENALFENDGPSVDKAIVNMTVINGEHYLDFQTIPLSKNTSSFSTNRIQGHSFAKVKFVDEHIEILHLDVEYLEEIIKSKRIRLKHEIVDDEIILTASTEELRAFIEKYGKGEKLFVEPTVLKNI